MKILPITFKIPAFKGRREDRNTASQLTKDNDYSLTENNQKRIEQAIENLSREKGENNIKFLLETAENLKYATNISNEVKPKHDWKTRLKNAAQKSLAVSDPITREKLAPEINRVFNTQKPLTEDEKNILLSKEYILDNIDKSQLKDEKNSNIKNIEKNLEHFIASSEIPIKQKKYILNRFEYLLSPDYNINPQLEDKKTLVLAEMLNDLVVNTGSKTPNTKAINQKSHGMCAAISIARKLMSYEYKKDYVDTILSELDDSEWMMVYDIANIGSGRKIPVEKTFIDFNEAQNKGFRIVDASTSQWMNIADMTGVNNKNTRTYMAFDAEHFSTFEDAHYLATMPEESLQAKQSYYQALITAKDKIDTAKESKLNKIYNYNALEMRKNSDLKLIKDLNDSLVQKIKDSLPFIKNEEANELKNDILSLQMNLSSEIDKIKDGKKYRFLPNEEDIVKKQKIKSFIVDKFKDNVSLELIDKNIDDIKDLLEMSKSVSDKFKPETSLSVRIKNDRKLFSAAAAYRTSMMMALYDRDLRTDFMIHYNIPDSESILEDNLQKVIEHIEKTSDETYINHFSTAFNIDANKESVLGLLEELKSTVHQMLTVQMDKAYNLLGMTDRKTDLLTQVTSLKELIEKNDKDELNSAALTIGVKPEKRKVIEILNHYEDILENHPSEKQYIEIFNKIGNKSQLQAFADTYGIIAEELENANESSENVVIQNFNFANNLAENAPIELSKEKLTELAGFFNQLSSNISLIRDVLTIQDENGRNLNTANPNELVIKAMEKEGRIIRANELLSLYNRYNAIDKLRSQDEFSSRQGKISDPSLYKYSSAEKETIKKIQKSLNAMASDTNKELNSIFHLIQKPLEEYSRQAGVEMSGMYWSPSEGTSGLYSNQELKILQQLTDKPYKATSNIEKAVNTIKNSPNSGVSGSNVFHDRPGGHAMYIAEIDKINGKDVIFHDNTWGASEFENTWTDSQGLTRTDYSDKRGGELGYITNSKWRNGNYIDNLTNKKGTFVPEKINSRELKKLKRSNEEFDFALLNDILLQGVPKKANDIAAGIKDNIFVPDNNFIEDFEKFAQNMPVEKVKAVKTKNETADKLYQKELRQIEQRLKVTPFNKGITTKQAYNELPDDDIIKVVFEKAAFEKSYEFDSKWKELAKINSIKELEPLKAEQKKAARENFEYAFAKDPKILYAYALNRNKSHIIKILNEALDKNGLKATDKQKAAIIHRTAIFEKDEESEFDGSLRHTIEFMVEKLIKQFDKNIPDSPHAQKAKEEIRQNLTKDISDGLYFNLHDLEKDTELQIAVKNYIDKKYNPETNEEFVEIYKKLQDMTTEDFRKETADAKDEDMALKNVHGFDMLQKYIVKNEPVQNTIHNLTYQKHILDSIDYPDTKNSYKYKKLQRRISGATYDKGRNFEDLYRTFYSSLSSLTYERMFNKYKAEAYKNYGVFPAYPKIDILNDNMLKNRLDPLEETVYKLTERIRDLKINLFVYEQTDKIDEFLNRFNNDAVLSSEKRELLNKMAGDFITANYGDAQIGRSLNAAAKIMEMPANAKVDEFKQAFAQWKNEINAVKNLYSASQIKEAIKSDSQTLKGTVNVLINADFPKRYRRQIKDALEKWIKEEVKGSKSFYDTLLEKRILEDKIEHGASGHLTPAIKTSFIDKLTLQVQKLKSAKTAANYNSISMNMSYANTMTSMLSVASELDDIDTQQVFTARITRISRMNEKLTKDEIKNIVNSEFTTLSGGKNVVSKKNFNLLIDNLHALNKEMFSKPKFDKAVATAQSKLDSNVDGFLNRYIRPDAQNAIKTKIREYIEKELTTSKKAQFNNEKAFELNENFKKLYKEHHILNHPTEILDRFVELSAKGGEIENAPNDFVKYRLKTERDVAKSYLDTSLTLASLVEIQSLLKEAEDLGNPSLVASKFKNYDVHSLIDKKTGMFLTMSDDESIDFIVRSLILENDTKTAAMFLEKLGLTEKFLKIEDGMIDVENHKKTIRKIENIVKVTNKQSTFIKKEMENFGEEFDNAPDFEARIDAAKKRLSDNTKNLSRKKNIKIVLDALEDAKIFIKENPDILKSLVINQSLNSVIEIINNDTNNDLSKLQKELKDLYTVYNFIKELDIPVYAIANIYVGKIDDKFQKITEYNQEVLYNTSKSSDIVELYDE